MTIDKQSKLTLLKAIKYRGDIFTLRKQGYEFFQISQFLNQLIEAGLIHSKDGKLLLTNIGDIELESLYKEEGRSGKAKWIDPEYHSQIPIFNPNDIYIPDPDDLWYL